MNSIRRLLLVALIGVMSVVIVVASALSYHAGLQEAGEMFDAKLAHSSRVLMSLVDEPLGDLAVHEAGDPLVVRVWQGQPEGVGEQLARPAGHAYETKLAFQARDAAGRLLLRSDSGPTAPLAPLRAGFDDVVIDGAHWRTFSLRSSRGNWYQSAERADIREELAGDLAEGTLWPLLLALPLLALFVWLVVGWSMRGLLKVSGEVESRAADRMAPIETTRVPIEVQGLVKAINGLLQRLDQTLARERRFTADAAHEMRTPIAALRVHSHNQRTAITDAERADSQGHLDAGIARIERLLEQLLVLGRVEPGAPTATALQRVDLQALAAQQLGEQAALFRSRRIVTSLAGDALIVAGDEAGLDALVGNLVGNAMRYAPVGGAVAVTLGADDGMALLAVEDSGPGIPEEARERVFDRFHRELGSGVEGSGLGLAIVREVVARHDGRIALDASPSLGGLRARVWLPLG